VEKVAAKTEQAAIKVEQVKQTLTDSTDQTNSKLDVIQGQGNGYRAEMMAELEYMRKLLAAEKRLTAEQGIRLEEREA
jgi:hypothetical protein